MKSTGKKKFFVDKMLPSTVLQTFKKHDSDKLRYDLIPSNVLKALAEIFTYGSKKYEDDNWKKCEDMGRFNSAVMRHFEAHRAGEKNDQESGYTHLAHALTNICFLLYFELDKEA